MSATELSLTEQILLAYFSDQDHAPESSPRCAGCAGDGAWEELIDPPDLQGGTVWVVCSICDGSGKL